ncbi:hypothetical protein KC19_12G014300 [Ceratodon purpureus]|uniref:Uncharacterized protein n=1 Tax=Ceratodon purpureus TaxID=3225 RepID=A0A8T0G3I6_CERPU|nr:hypothetical protein KC19_12G014300 [Ceratodon purpureus]
MGFTVLLQPGIRFGAFGEVRSTFVGRALPQLGRAHGVHVETRFVGVAVRNEFGGEEKRQEEKNKLLGVASASIGFNAILLMSVTKPAVPVSHKETPFSWLSLPLLAIWGAILLNAFVQYRVLERLTGLPQRREITGRVDFTLKQRVDDLEENVREFVTTARGLSKQVEKLGVRFRATKRTLRDPMLETAAYAQKTSEVTTILAQREDRLEEELRGLQRALLAMQEHQVKQLALISLALKRTQNEGTKQLPSSVNKSGLGHKTSADAHVRAVPSVEIPKTTVRKTSTYSSNSTNGVGKESKIPTGARDELSVNGTSQRGDSALKSTFSSEGSLSKVDFWKDSVTPSAVVSKMTAKASSSAASDRGDGPDRSNLGSFFNGRKRSTVNPPNVQALDNEPLNSDVHNSGPEVWHEPEDVSSYVEQPDYDSDSWLR